MKMIGRWGAGPPFALALLALIVACACFALAGIGKDGGARRTAKPRPQPTRNPLNPHGFPQIATCKAIKLNDPAGEARANIAKGDLRPFTVSGFTPGSVPGVYCSSGDYRLESRGGTFVSDMPDACGSFTFSNAPPDRMEAYNRALASDPRFQKITGCRASTYCEERYRKGFSAAKQRDPQCPAEPEVLVRVAESGTAEDLAQTLKDFAPASVKTRDTVTAAFVAALGRARWQNAEMLLRAGADINGRVFDADAKDRKCIGSPLEAVFNQNGDKAGKIARARWLFAHGANFSNPRAHQAMTWAASSNDVDAVNFLLARGASPNGVIAKEEQDRLAQDNIQSAGGGYGFGQTPFYEALSQAKGYWARRTPTEIAYADAEQRKGRINAVTLYRAGGRFFAGLMYNDLRRKPDIKLASILLAAAHREGRLKELIERILYPNDRDTPFNPGGSEGERALIAYLRKVESCPDIRPVAKGDYVKLCGSQDL